MKQMTAMGNRDLHEQCRIYEKVLNQEDAAGGNDSDVDSPTAKMRSDTNSCMELSD